MGDLVAGASAGGVSRVRTPGDTHLVGLREYSDAKYVALRAFEADPGARDLECRLIALYWKLGARSAAEAQYAHYASQERADGVDPPSFREIREDLLGTLNTP